MGRRKKVIEETIPPTVERPKTQKSKQTINKNIEIIDELIEQALKEYKYTENEFEEGAKVGILRYLNMAKDRFNS